MSVVSFYSGHFNNSMNIDYITPAVKEFKTQFNAFAYSNDERYKDSNDIAIVNVDYLTDLLKSKTQEIANKMIAGGYPIPTADNGYSNFSIKQYIMFSVACILTANYASNSDLINWIRERANYYEEKLEQDISSIASGKGGINSVALCGDLPKQ